MNQDAKKPNKSNKGLEMREKGKILLAMKERFGQEKAPEMFKFIDEHFELGS